MTEEAGPAAGGGLGTARLKRRMAGFPPGAKKARYRSTEARMAKPNRKIKKANHGKRPCAARRARKINKKRVRT